MDSIPQQLLLQLILILVNAFFASTEIAVLSLNTSKLKRKAEQGEKTAKRLLKHMEQPAGFLSTIQIGITIAGFLGSAFAADNFSEYLVNWVYYDLGYTGLSLAVLDTLALIIITLVLSYFTLILGELVPKRIAMQKPYEVAKWSIGVVSTVAFLMRPVVAFLSFSTNVILRLLHMKVEAEEESVSEEEIRMMVDLGEERGVIDGDEKEWIENVFAFDDTLIKDAMTRNMDVVSLSLLDTEEKILSCIKESGLSRFPVYGENRNEIIGVLYAKDYLMADKEERKELRMLVRPAYFVSENRKTDELFKDMQKRKVHFAVVVDEFGEISGVITLEDLLEELVGNIYDEYDEEEEEMLEKVSDTVWRVSGECDVQDINEALSIALPISSDYDSIAGYLLTFLAEIPKDHTTLDIEDADVIFHVKRIEHRRIREVLIEKKI